MSILGHNDKAIKRLNDETRFDCFDKLSNRLTDQYKRDEQKVLHYKTGNE